MVEKGFHVPSDRSMISKHFEPIFQHDCKKCIFVGGFEYDAAGWDWVDLYVCKGHDEVSIVYRYGNEPSEYGAMNAEYCLLLDSNVKDNSYHKSLRTILGREFQSPGDYTTRYRFKLVLESYKIEE